MLGDLYNILEKQEWCGVDKIVENQEGEYISELENGTKYILKKWFQGRECDTRKPGELLEASGMLAKFHLLMQNKVGISTSDSETIKDEYRKHNRELKKVRSFVRNNPLKNKFEMEFLKSFDEMFQWAKLAEDMLAVSGYDYLYQQSKEQHCLTHSCRRFPAPCGWSA